MSVFHLHRLFSQISRLFFFFFQCIEHVVINKFLCSLVCTWIAIIDSQFYIIRVYLSMFHWNEMLTSRLPGCKPEWIDYIQGYLLGRG